MPTASHQDTFRGHTIELRNQRYVFTDTGADVATTWKTRPCGHCNAHNTPEGHDACLGHLPGVLNACCGHGRTSDAYIQFADWTIIRGAAVFTWLRTNNTP